MYNKYLETFITVADCGSLTKASEVLYLTPTSLMKRINQLEYHLNIKLFIRTHKGLILSEAGKTFYEDSLYIVQYLKDSIERAQNATNNNEYHIRIGTSLMNPVQKINGMIQKISLLNPAFQFHIVPFNDYRESYINAISHLGDQIDIIAGIYGFSNWTKSLHNTLTLFNEPICVAVSKNHRLAEKESINITELYEESVFITKPGDSATLDLVRNDLIQNHPEIHLMSMQSFDLTIYNQCATTNNILLTIPMWASLHPMLKIIYVNWDYFVPYGIIYALQPSVGVQEFIKCIERSISN